MSDHSSNVLSDEIGVRLSEDDPWAVRPQHLVICQRCEKPVVAIEQGNVVERPGSFTSTKVALLECASCNNAIVVTLEDGPDGWDEPRQVWPAGPRVLSSKIPAPLRRELAEARDCCSAKAYTASVVMVRRTLEGVCAEHQISKRPLQKALQEMASQGLLDGRLLEWADSLRVLGNEGAHYTGSPVSREDATDALALAEAVLDYLYVLTAQFDEFKQRRQMAAETVEPSREGKST